MSFAAITSLRLTLAAASAIGLVLSHSPARAADAIPATPEAGAIKIGLEPWLGYGQWHIANKKGLFKTEGLDNVAIVNFNEDKDINAALASGQLDVANIGTHTAMAMVAAGLPIKIVMLEDFSLKADAILAGKDVATVADLKGKQVAFEQGTTSDILLNYALKTAGLTIADVKPVPMPASDAGAALIAGRVPVAATYEPYLTTALHQNKDTKLLFTAGANPGLVSDVLVVREDFLKSKPGQVAALVRVWDDALKYYKANTEDGRKIISEAVGSAPADLATAFDGVQFYSVAENKTAFSGPFQTKTFVEVEAAAKTAGILTKDVSAADMIDPRFVGATP